MDADCIDIQRDCVLSRREKRWSMNSQRLEEIVAELMKPISDVRRSFDTDLSAAELKIANRRHCTGQQSCRQKKLVQISFEESKLLEEYLTEAGLHALEAGGDGSDSDDEPLAPAAPNFAELALLLQHSASVYGRKVDFLYQHVLSVSDSLHTSAQELERSTAEAEGAGGGDTPGGRRRRRVSAGAFEPLALGACGASVREPAAARPPPTLPRVYVELEPRQLTPADRPLTDYDGEPVGLLADFHVAWRLQDGMLVDELENRGGRGGGLRPIPLMELQAAIEAAAPPPPPDLPATPPPHEATPPRSPSPLGASTPLPAPRRERKRRGDTSSDDMVGGCYRIVMSKALLSKLRKLEEFSVERAWVAGVVASRRDHIRRSRRLLADDRRDEQDFRGFDACDVDVGGFAGWSSTEAATATAACDTTAAGDGDSDDDGFFERSSLGDSDASRTDDPASASALVPHTQFAAPASWAEWRAGVVARAAAGEARGLDVSELAERLLAALPPPPACPAAAAAPAPPLPCRALLADAARDRADVPGLFLATLFLANAGNVEIIQGAPLTLDSFSVRLLSADARLYAAAAHADPHFLR